MTKDEFQTVLSAEERRLSAFCRSLCQNEHDAQDLYQETVLRFWNSSVRLDDGVHTYLFRICINTFRNLCRTRKRHPEVYEDEQNEYLSKIPDGSNREEYVLLYDAIARLKPDHRIVLALTYFRDLSEKEVAGILQIPDGTVKTRLSAAKEALKKELSV